MSYSFLSSYYIENKRTYIKIPFNVWETCGKKGNIPVRVLIEGTTFECKLIPKGNGDYVIPINKDIVKKLSYSDELNVEFLILDQLTRINNNSPYSRAKPIRKIGSISYLKQPSSGYCGQTCLAMLTGLSIDEVIKITKSTKWQASISKVLEALDYFGLSYTEPVYSHGRKVEFPKCCIICVKGKKKNHLSVYFNGVFYDPTCGIIYDTQYEDIIFYLEIKIT